jgi:hypothetical protein
MEQVDYIQKAKDAALWLVNTQLKAPMYPASSDLNIGRYVRNYDVDKGKITALSTNWMSGMTIYSLCMMYDYTIDETYRLSAEMGVYYIKSLQCVMEDDPSNEGAISEIDTMCRFCCPRDALSAAWGMLRLFKINGQRSLYERAKLFAEWHSTYAMIDGYPLWMYQFDDKGRSDLRIGSFQSGSALFYLDLYRISGDEKHKKHVQGIVDYYIAHFFDEKEGLKIVYDPETDSKYDLDDEAVWCDMHKYNDDFGALAVMNQYHETNAPRYYDYLQKYLDWVISKQKKDGSFGEYTLSVSSCVAALNLLNFYMISKEEKYLSAAEKAMEHLLANTIDCKDQKNLHGGVLGLNECVISDVKTISIRVTMYAVYTYLLFGIFKNKLYADKTKVSKDIVDNPMFIGLKYME